MAAPAAWIVYNDFKLYLGRKRFALHSDTVKMALFQSTSNCGDTALATAQYPALTNEVVQANGYLTGGVTCAATWFDAAGTEIFDVADAQWTAAGGPITARFAVLYDDSEANKRLIAYCLLDSAPADVTAGDGSTLAVQISINGVFTLA
jgi:hypothetical protein